MEIYDVLKKLIGEIEPVGDSRIDSERLKNLEVTIDIADKLIYKIYNISCGKDDFRDSVKKAGIKANAFMDQLHDEF